MLKESNTTETHRVTLKTLAYLKTEATIADVARSLNAALTDQAKYSTEDLDTGATIDVTVFAGSGTDMMRLRKFPSHIRKMIDTEEENEVSDLLDSIFDEVDVRATGNTVSDRVSMAFWEQMQNTHLPRLRDYIAKVDRMHAATDEYVRKFKESFTTQTSLELRSSPAQDTEGGNNRCARDMLLVTTPDGLVAFVDASDRFGCE